MGHTLIVNGTLTGMGCHVECVLMATRSEHVRTPHPIYTRCAIVDAPQWLPDGYYEVTFNGQSAFLHRKSSCWSIGHPWRQQAEAVSKVA